MSITSDIADGILECADKSLVGEMTYHQGHKHKVVPLSVGVSSRGNEVLYCWERDRATNQFGTRMFKVDDIVKFEPTGEPLQPRFKIKANVLHRRFDPYAKNYVTERERRKIEDKRKHDKDNGPENENGTNVNPAERMTKHASFDERRVMRIAQKIMEFSGAEAHLYVPGKTGDSYRVVGDDGRSAGVMEADEIRGDNLMYCGRYREGDGMFRKIAHGIKEGDPDSIRMAAEQMAGKVPKNAVLVPIPGRTGRATTALTLANEIAKLSGAEVIDALAGQPRQSFYDMKRRGEAIDMDMLGFRLGIDLPKGRPVIFVDNVVATGTTANAALGLVETGSILAYAFDDQAFGDAIKSRSH